SEPGGEGTMSFPERTISDIGGIKEITGQNLVKELVKQAETFDPTIVCGQFISDVQPLQNGNFRLISQTGEIHETRTIILAVGNGLIKPMKLEIDGVECDEYNNLHYTVEEYSQFTDKNVLISGGGDSAVDWANELRSIAKNITVIHRRDEFRAFENNVQKMKEQAEVLTPYIIKEMQNEGAYLTQVTLEKLKTGKKRDKE